MSMRSLRGRPRRGPRGTCAVGPVATHGRPCRPRALAVLRKSSKGVIAMNDDTMNPRSLAALLGPLVLLAGTFAAPLSAQDAGPSQPIARTADDAALAWG